jgi:hypothetical protein
VLIASLQPLYSIELSILIVLLSPTMSYYAATFSSLPYFFHRNLSSCVTCTAEHLSLTSSILNVISVTLYLPSIVCSLYQLYCFRDASLPEERKSSLLQSPTKSFQLNCLHQIQRSLPHMFLLSSYVDISSRLPYSFVSVELQIVFKLPSRHLILSF